MLRMVYPPGRARPVIDNHNLPPTHDVSVYSYRTNTSSRGEHRRPTLTSGPVGYSLDTATSRAGVGGSGDVRRSRLPRNAKRCTLTTPYGNFNHAHDLSPGNLALRAHRLADGGARSALQAAGVPAQDNRRSAPSLERDSRARPGAG